MSNAAITQAIQTPTPATPQYKVADYPFLLVSTQKIAIMSALTLNFYDIYWMYKNWQAVNATEGTGYRPLARGIFSLFFIRSLFQRIDPALASQALAAWVGAAVISNLHTPLAALGVLRFIILIRGQKIINDQHTGSVPTTFSRTEILCMILGSLGWLWILTP